MSTEWEVITRLDSTSGLSLSKLHATTDPDSSMHCLSVPACFALFFGILANWSLAEENESELTADQFVVNAASLYANGKCSGKASARFVNKPLKARKTLEEFLTHSRETLVTPASFPPF